MSECRHGMEREWCGTCSDETNRPRPKSVVTHRHTETKQDVLNDITDLLGMPRSRVSVGSSLPSDVFIEAAKRVGVPATSMPEICEGIILTAGMSYSRTFDSRDTVSGGGSTVTLEGAKALREALRTLLS